jgi:hypothetical protein
MELRIVNPLEANNLSNFLFLKIMKIEFKNKHHMFIFLRDVIIAYKTKLIIFFTSLIKASLVDINLFWKEIFLIIFGKFSWFFVVA